MLFCRPARFLLAAQLALTAVGCAPESSAKVDAADGTATDGSGDSADVGSLFADIGPPDSAVMDNSDAAGTPAGGWLLVGTVVTPHIAFAGQVLVQEGTIICAEPGEACAAVSGAASALRVETSGLIFPGLIDMHNHILFDIFDNDDWMPQKSYVNHTEWPKEARYAAMLDVKQCLENASQGKPTWCPAPYNTKEGNLKCEMDKWGELKGLIAGTTSIVGLPGTTSACFGSIARTIDAAQNGLIGDQIQTSALFPPSTSSADGVCENFSSGATLAYLIHCGEGIDAKAKAEFLTLATVTTEDGCLLSPGTVVTHGTAFGAEEFAQMGAAGVGLTWSPASNVALYGSTTDIPTALDKGVTVSLGPDWSMGGSQNMLDELRFANQWDDDHWGDRLSPKALILMATVNAAQSLGLGSKLGKLAKGYAADLFVVDGDPADPWSALLKATPREIQLVMVGGHILYGDKAVQGAVDDSAFCEDTDVCGRPKFLCIALKNPADKLGQTMGEIRSALDKAMIDMDDATPTDGWNFWPLAPMVKCAK